MELINIFLIYVNLICQTIQVEQVIKLGLILLMKFLMTTCGNNSHSSKSGGFRPSGGSWKEVDVQLPIHKASQTCSLGLRFGNFAGKSIQQISSPSRKQSISCALFGLSLFIIHKMKSRLVAPQKSSHI